MSGEVATIAAYVSTFVISGVNVIDLPDVPSSLNSQKCPVLMPDLYEDQFMQNLQFARQSFGDGLNARVDIHYQLQWALFYKPVQENVTLLENYAAMTDLAMKILTAFLTFQSPSNNVVDFVPADLPKFGVVRDTTGTPFWGVTFRMDCYEFADQTGDESLTLDGQILTI